MTAVVAVTSFHGCLGTSRQRSTARRPTYSEISLGPVQDVRLDVVISPMPTVLSLAGDVAGRSQGVPPAWRDMVRDGMSGAAWGTLAPLFGPGALDVPHSLAPTAPVPDTDFESHFDEILPVATAGLPGEVEAMYGGDPAEVWRPVLRRPGPWVAAYASMMCSIWQAFRPQWRRAKPLLEREVTRVGTALVSGALEVVLAGLSPRWRYAQQSLSIPDTRPERFALAGRRLVLSPSVSGAGASMFTTDLADRIWLGYPVPALDTLWTNRRLAAAEDSLQLLLGPARAGLLQLLGTERTMSQLAEEMNCAASVVTYHCAPLVDAGLLYRVRRGRSVFVGRTDRATALLDLLAP